MAIRRGKPRDPHKERFWRETIEEQQRSGLSIAAYCQHHDLKAWTFRWWQHELRRRDRQGVQRSMTKRSGPSTDLVLSSAFLPVQVVPDDSGSSQDPTPIEIVLADRSTVRVGRGFDPTTLDAVLTVLEARRC
ncbi:IS66 family insertion sequence element accessory protein TnpA [Tautonia rosea]|uniref:IS66 family insertion sequence element accessory protein TnpA n=1 Tax=Tautonia rosea TaxID=2728037 RepID=UPI0014759B0B|nr:hypothetical protein [Tautonia rosea]